MSKVVILALSIDESILDSHFVSSFTNLRDSKEELDYNTVIFTQGFDYPDYVEGISFIRDDTMYNKGYSISEIRDYFTRRVISEMKPEFILHCDDDFKFGVNSLKSICNDVKLMEDNKDVGLTCMHYCKSGPSDPPEYYDFNPSRVATRSGVLFRVEAYTTWGSEYKVRYFEECFLATEIYRRGYKVMHSVSDTIHKTKPSGLGLSQERQYGKNNIPYSARKILCDINYLVPSIGKDKDGNDYLRYDIPLRVSDSSFKLHNLYHKNLLN